MTVQRARVVDIAGARHARGRRLERSRDAARAKPTQAPPEPDYQALVEGAADIIYALDLEGCFTFYNARGPDILGCRPGQFVGLHFSEILTPESAQIARAEFEKGIQGLETPASFEVEAYSLRGGTVQLEVRARNIYSDGRRGRIVGRQGVARDISELKQLHADLSEKAAHIALLEERIRIARELHQGLGIARELYDRVAQVVFGTESPSGEAAELLQEMKSSLLSQITRSLELSKVDLRVIAMVAEGLSNREIGTRLRMSPETVKSHLSKMMGLLQVRNRTALVAECARRGLL